MTETSETSVDDRSGSVEPPAMRVDHVGIAVESIASAESLLFALGCEKIHEEASEYGSFTWATYVLGDASRIELIAPDDGAESFLTEFLDRNGPGLHHVTIEVADLERAVEALEAEGVPVVDRAEFDHWGEAFVAPSNPTGALFQLMEYYDEFAATREAGRRLFVRGEALR